MKGCSHYIVVTIHSFIPWIGLNNLFHNRSFFLIRGITFSTALHTQKRNSYKKSENGFFHFSNTFRLCLLIQKETVILIIYYKKILMSQKKWSLENKKVLITGASKGIGWATASEMGDLGAELFLVSRNRVQLTDATQELKNRGISVTAITGDITIKEDRENIVEKIRETGASLDALVNNVGMNIRKKMVEYTSSEVQQIFHTNLFAALELTQSIHPMLLNAAPASVTIIGS